MKKFIWRFQEIIFILTIRYMEINKRWIQIVLLPLIILFDILVSLIGCLIYLLYYVPKYGFKEGWTEQIKNQMDNVNKLIEELK